MDWTALFHFFGLDVNKCGFAGQYDCSSRHAANCSNLGYWELSSLVPGQYLDDSSYVQCRTFSSMSFLWAILFRLTLRSPALTTYDLGVLWCRTTVATLHSFDPWSGLTLT